MKKHLMKAFTVLVLGFAPLAAEHPLFEVYEILGVEHSVGDFGGREELQNAVAVYFSAPEDRIELRKQRTFQSDGSYFHTILHELAHWTGGEEGRSSRHNPDTDAFVEEVIAEYTAVKLSEVLYGGKYARTYRQADHYLRMHPLSRTLTEEEELFALRSIEEAYEIIIERIKKLDVENRLGL